MSVEKKDNSESQEIDLFDVFRKIGGLFERLNTLLFRIIRFFVRNAILVFLLIIIGSGLGFFIDITKKSYKHQIIVEPNFKSIDYLYSKMDLLTSKIENNDTLFLKSIGILNPSVLNKISVEPVVDVYNFINNNKQNLELLQLMAQNGDLKTAIKETATSKNYNYHTINLVTNSLINQKKIIDPILNYLNSSSYFFEIQKISESNIQQKIKEKEEVINQINQILTNFNDKLVNNKTKTNLIYYNENLQLNNIIKTKDSLINVIGILKLEKFNYTKIIHDKAIFINRINDKNINGKLKFLIPLTLITLFIFFTLFKSFYRKQLLKKKEV